MNLKWHLITRIWLLAFLCLVLASGLVLWQTQRDQQKRVAAALDVVVQQMKNRLTVTAMGFRATGFDSDGRFSFWDPLVASSITAGVCIRYIDELGTVRTNSCRNGAKSYRHDSKWETSAPVWFASIHRALLNPGRERSVPLTLNGKAYGQVAAALEPRTEITEAWHRVNALIGLAVTTVVVLCLLVYFVVSHALRPTREILSGLHRLEEGELDARLPRMRLTELQRMSDGFNRLAESLEQSIAQRAELTRKLVNLQEEERRHLARELHDEFGQCLAAINAVAASIIHTAEREQSTLSKEGENLSRIATHMMQALRNMLNRLRPPGIDELSLRESIEGLVAEYGGRGTRIDLQMDGGLDGLPETINVSVYRIVQECLTNIAKHSGARHAVVKLAWAGTPAGRHPGSSIDVSVEDDGNANDSNFPPGPGMGLLGMRERVTALGGRLTLRPRPGRGLIVSARIPVAPQALTEAVPA